MHHIFNSGFGDRSRPLELRPTSRHSRVGPVESAARYELPPTGAGGGGGRRAAHRRDDAPPRRHEDELLRLLYEEHAEPLLGFVLRLTAGDVQRAEDIVQETLLRAWRNAHKLGGQPGASLRPWLVTVARRIAIDEHRSASARAPETFDRDLSGYATTDETERVLAQLTVTEALRSLSPAHQEILAETYLRDRTVNDAATSLGLPLGTAKSRVFYALRALRAALEQRGLHA